MSRLSQVSLKWADGDYTFRLRIKHLIELQEKCDAGPSYILARLQQGAWHVEDVREPIRLGLIGGGLEPVKALKLVERYVDDQPLMQNAMIAEVIVSAAIVGVEEEKPPKPLAATDQSQSSNEEKSGGPHSLDQDSQQASPQET